MPIAAGASPLWPFITLHLSSVRAINRNSCKFSSSFFLLFLFLHFNFKWIEISYFHSIDSSLGLFLKCSWHTHNKEETTTTILIVGREEGGRKCTTVFYYTRSSVIRPFSPLSLLTCSFSPQHTHTTWRLHVCMSLRPQALEDRWDSPPASSSSSSSSHWAFSRCSSTFCHQSLIIPLIDVVRRQVFYFPCCWWRSTPSTAMFSTVSAH